MKRIFVLLLLSGVLATSCVSTRRFNSLRAELIASQGRLEHSRTLLNEYSDQADALARTNQQLQTEIATLTDKHAELKDRYDRLLASGSDDASRLAQQLAENQRALNANSARVEELERLLKAREDALASIRSKVTKALTGFDGKGLSISTREGKIYISLDDKLLFKSGSFELDPAGARAIGDLAAVLASNPDINIMVEGHTDDVPYRGKGPLKDNLDLSAMRATSVTRMLLENQDIDPARIISAGRGEWLPVTMGISTSARAQNRRTEIILTPQLDELMQLIN